MTSALLPVGLALTAVLLLGGFLVARVVDALRWRTAARRRLEELTSAWSEDADRPTEEPAILRRVLPGSAETLRCDAVLVVLDATPTVEGYVAVATPGDPTAGAPADATAGAAVDAAAGTEPVDVRSLPWTRGVPGVPQGAVAVPLDVAGERIGELRALGGRRADDPVRRRLALELAHFVASAVGTTRAGEAARRQMQRDQLTGLATRAMLEEDGDELLDRAAEAGRHAAVLLVDVDELKAVNDLFGHAAGDRLLATVGRRLEEAAGPDALIVRLGGDEFVVLAHSLDTPDACEALATELLGSIGRELLVGEAPVQVRASLGIAVLGENGATLEELLAAADQAMYQAKARRTGGWARAVGRADLAQPDLVAALVAGLPDEQVVVHHQPQTRAADGRVVGFEALVRWQHPTQGLLGPGAFLQAAERSGRMARLTATVLDRALADLPELRAHAPGATMSVNVSMRHLVDPGFAAEVGDALTRHQADPGALVLEVTEPAPGPTDAVEDALGRLAELGVRVSIHEFGVGQSSVTALSRYPAIREVKIHPGLAGRVVDDPAAERLVRAMVESARALGVDVVGEGVESDAVAARLTRLGCDRLQGYHLHEPATVSVLLPWLRERERAGSAAPLLPGAPTP